MAGERVDVEWLTERLRSVEAELADLADYTDELQRQLPLDVETRVEEARVAVILALKALGAYK